jgi:putative addiction module component (TIGR02574 family)
MESVSSPAFRSRSASSATNKKAKLGMNANSILQQVEQLPVEDQIVLVQQIWDEIAKRGQVPLSDAKRAELNRRLAAYRANPAKVVAWEQIREDRRKT